MDKNRVVTGLATIGMICCLVFSFYIGKKSSSTEPQQHEIIVDTVFVNTPVPDVETTIDTVFVKVPAYITGTDEHKEENPTINVEIVRKEYSDSLYRAVISGPKIGGYSPAIESMEVYSKSVVVTQPNKTFRPYISACVSNAIVGVGGGVRINSRVDIGLKYVRVGNKNGVMFETNITF